MRDWIALYLEEDLGERGDVTSDTLVPAGQQGRARIVSRGRAFVAGSAHAAEVFRRLGARAEGGADGRWVEPGGEVLRVSGPTRAILTGERTALNILARMSGIATLTRTLSERLAAAGCGAVVAGTRKTTPGFRVFEKEAIRIGGGDPHRMGLHDEAMVKDNHREALAGTGSTADAAGESVRRLRAAHPGLRITCEAESLQEAEAAAAAGADWILIDNQDPATGRRWAEAIWARWPNVKVEVSGGITPVTLPAYGWADRVSLGGLTQNAPGRDFSLEWGDA